MKTLNLKKFPVGFLKFVKCVAIDSHSGVPMSHFEGIDKSKLIYNANTHTYSMLLDPLTLGIIPADIADSVHSRGGDQKYCEYCKNKMQGISINSLSHLAEDKK